MDAKELRKLYNHPVWPSPNARVAAKRLGCQTKRLTHEEALNWLARRTGRSLEDFLKMEKYQSWRVLGCTHLYFGYDAVHDPIHSPYSRYCRFY